jgi:hypothetical protein
MGLAQVHIPADFELVGAPTNVPASKRATIFSCSTAIAAGLGAVWVVGEYLRAARV